MSSLTENSVLITSLQALEDLDEMFKFVGISGVYAKTGQVAQGVLQAETNKGQWAPVMSIGVALVKAGGSITAGAKVESDADGCAVTHTSGVILGTALDSGSSGDLIRVLLNIANATNNLDAVNRAQLESAIETALANFNAMEYKGAIDCSGNPNYPAANAGYIYYVSVAGIIGGASGVAVQVGDIIACKVDNSPSGDQATVGANWDLIPSGASL